GGDVEFPKDWANKVGRDPSQPKLTKQEIALLKALNSTLSVNYNGVSFKEGIEDLQERTGQTILLGQASLEEAMVEYNDPVSFKANKVTVRTVLRKILGDKGLTYVLKDASVQVLSPKKAREEVSTRAYPVADLIAADPRQGLVLGRLQARSNAALLIALIQQTADPQSWKANNENAPGTIFFDEITQSPVVTQPGEMPYMPGGGWGGRP